MKVIKFSKDGCAPCIQVTEFLDKAGVKYETINPFETEDFDLVLKHRIKNVPITILFNSENNVLTRVAGVDERKLNRLVEIYNNGE